MYVELTKNFETIGSPERFAIQELTIGELELIQESLITYNQIILQDPEVFKDDCSRCIEIYQKIDTELIRSRS